MATTPTSPAALRRSHVVLLACALGVASYVLVPDPFGRALRLVYEDIGEDHAAMLHQLELGAARHIRERGEAGFEPEFVRRTLAAQGEDPWGRDFRFDVSSERAHAVRIYSLGADGRPGGVGRDEDYVVWVDLESSWQRSHTLDLPPDGFVW